MHGLVALMELQASRVGSRTDPAGEPVLLADQDRRRWDRLLIRHGLQALARASGPRRLAGQAGPTEEARVEFGRGAALTGNERERAVFRARAGACLAAVPAPG